MKTLIMDLSSNIDTKLLLVNFSHNSFQIISGIYFSHEEEDNIYSSLNQRIKNEKLENLPIYLILPKSIVHNKLFFLPPMPKKEITNVLTREISDKENLSDPFILDFKQIEIELKGEKKLRITAFFSKNKDVDDQLKKLKNVHIRPSKILPELDSFFSLLSKDIKDDATVLFELSSNKVILNICQNKNWLYKREFMYSRTKNAELSDSNLERMSIELNRTFQYFKQKNRDVEIKDILIHGTHPQLLKIKSYLAENQPLKTELLSKSHLPDFIKFAKNLENIDDFVSYFAVSMGIAISILKKEEVNLLPPEFIEKESLPKRLVGLSISAMILFLIMGLGFIYLTGIKRNYHNQIQEQKDYFAKIDFREINHLKSFSLKLNKEEQKKVNQTFGPVNTPLQFIAFAKDIRKNFYQKEFFINFPVTFSFTTANFLRKISLAVSKDIEISNISFNQKKLNLEFILNGKILDKERLLEQFLVFYQEIKEFDNILDITFSKVRINLKKFQGKNRSKNQKNQELDQEGEQLYFSIKGTLELE